MNDLKLMQRGIQLVIDTLPADGFEDSQALLTTLSRGVNDPAFIVMLDSMIKIAILTRLIREQGGEE